MFSKKINKYRSVERILKKYIFIYIGKIDEVGELVNVLKVKDDLQEWVLCLLGDYFGYQQSTNISIQKNNRKNKNKTIKMLKK